ncbi:MAG: hypothetical protein EOP04_06095 [Proteobacteria bacterium]|nr:MAG: hypothetical protein EOP04_06095 [Pseudomonadota bacterium]
MERLDWVNKPSYTVLVVHTLYAPFLFLFPVLMTSPRVGLFSDFDKVASIIPQMLVVFGLLSVVVDLVLTFKDKSIHEHFLPFSAAGGFGLCAIFGAFDIYGRPANEGFQILAYVTLLLTAILLFTKIRQISVAKSIAANSKRPLSSTI